MINKIFYFLLFCSIAGAGVLWWLMNAVPQPGASDVAAPNQPALKVEDIVEDPEEISADERADDSIEDPLDPPPEEMSETEDASTSPGLFDSEDPEGMPEEASEEQPEEIADEEVVADADPSVLSITSSPSGVTVYVNGVRRGVTPFETTLTDKEQTLRFQLEGYVPVERKAPAESQPEGAFMSWRISMVKDEPTSSAADEMAEVGDYFPSGMVGPVFIQVKSMDQNVHTRTQVVNELQAMREQLSNDKVVACSVDLGNSGMWYRILIGPFSSKSEARSSLAFVKKSVGINDVFVTGAQKCL